MTFSSAINWRAGTGGHFPGGGVAAGGAAKASLVYREAALTSWRTALANRENAPATIAVLGHSWIESGTVWTTGIPAVLAQEMRTAYPTTGVTGYAYSNYLKQVGSLGTGGIFSNLPAGGPMTATSTGGGIGARCFQFDTVGKGVTGTATFTHIDLWAGHLGPSGTMTVNVDGTDVGTITNNGPGFGNFQRVRLGPFSAASHTLTLTCTAITDGARCDLSGVALYNGERDKGVQVFEAGMAATLVGDRYSSTNYFKQYSTIAPDVGVFMFQVNDYNAQTAVATFKSNYQAHIAAFRAYAGATCPVLIVVPPAPNNLGSLSIAYANYTTACREICDADPYTALFDLAALMPSAATDGGTNKWNPDLLHLSEAGRSDAGRYVAQALGV